MIESTTSYYFGLIEHGTVEGTSNQEEPREHFFLALAGLYIALSHVGGDKINIAV